MNAQRARIVPPTDTSKLPDDELSRVPQINGEPALLFRTLSHHPALMARFNAFGGVFMVRSVLAPELREVLAVRIATLTRSEYELGHHVGIARSIGFDDDKIERLARAEPQPGKTRGTDDLLMTLVDELVAGLALSAETLEAMMAQFSHAQVLELLMLAGCYRMVGATLATLDVAPGDEVDPSALAFARRLLTR